MEKKFSKTYSCPVCGLKEWLVQHLKLEGEVVPKVEGFFKQLSDELKVRGIASKEWGLYLDNKRGVAADQTIVDRLPIGTELPGFLFSTDVCPECGCVYAVQMQRLEVKKTIQPVVPIVSREAMIYQRGGKVNA